LLETLPIQEWFNQINLSLEELGLKGAKFSRRIAELRGFVSSGNPDQFHQGLEWLGKFLGATTKQWSSDGAPDGLWLFETAYSRLASLPSSRESGSGGRTKTQNNFPNTRKHV
jgi:hypothetical protein